MLRTAALVCAVSLPFLAVAGCGSLVPPDASGMLKIVTGQMNNLSGEEIQALTTSPIVAAYAPDLQLTDVQADAIAEFLADNNIATIADLQALLLRVQTDPTSIVLPDGFFELFADFQPPTDQQAQ
jgi:hypothetical protein